MDSQPSNGSKVLVISYGGSHIKILLPVIEELEKVGIHVDILGLTTAVSFLKEKNRKFYGFKDFIDPIKDQQALMHGRRIVDEHHDGNIGIDYEESVAYLGVSWWELLQDYGETQALALFKQWGRQIFLPKRFISRLFDAWQPHVYLSTNSPRAEWAGLYVARERGIPTIRVSDMLGNQRGDGPRADVICLSCNEAESLIKTSERYEPGSHFVVTGSPQFDWLLPWQDKSREDILNYKRSLGIDPPTKPLILYVLTASLADGEEDGFRALAQISRERNDVAIAIRAHPNAGYKHHLRSIERYWPEKRFIDLSHEPLGWALVASDMILNKHSTVSVEAILLGKRVITIRSPNEKHLLPISDFGWAIDAYHPEGIKRCLEQILNEPISNHEKIKNSVHESFHFDGRARYRIAEIVQKAMQSRLREEPNRQYMI